MRNWHRWQRFRLRRRTSAGRRRLGPWAGGLIGLLLALALIGHLEFQLRPVLEAVATAKVQHAAALALDAAVAEEIGARGVRYSDLVTIERNEAGDITALTSDMAAMNDLRSGIFAAVLVAIDQLDPDGLSIPVGNLTGISLFSGRGFDLPVEVAAVGSAHGDFQSQFTSAGINQTRHRIVLEVTVSVEILLPGETIQTQVSAQVPVAETVIVGQVPDTYLGLSSSPQQT